MWSNPKVGNSIVEIVIVMTSTMMHKMMMPLIRYINRSSALAKPMQLPKILVNIIMFTMVLVGNGKCGGEVSHKHSNVPLIF